MIQIYDIEGNLLLDVNNTSLVAADREGDLDINTRQHTIGSSSIREETLRKKTTWELNKLKQEIEKKLPTLERLVRRNPIVWQHQLDIALDQIDDIDAILDNR